MAACIASTGACRPSESQQPGHHQHRRGHREDRGRQRPGDGDGSELKQCAIAEGMETLRQDGWRRVAHGKTTIEEVVRVTQTDEVMAETTQEAEPVVAAESAEMR